MGNALSSCPCRRNRINSMKEITLLMIGLDNAGKTCTAKHLLGESTCDAVPTVGFTSVQIRHGKFNICVYDIGGGPKIRGIWKNYYALVHGLIFVVDASDPQRFEECKSEIGNVLKDERIAGKPMLLLFNKQDLDGAVNETELVSQLDLEALVNEQHCPTRVEASCAIYDQSKIKDPGIQSGFNWLIGHIGKEFPSLSERVEKEKDIQMKKEQLDRELRMERVRKIREEREQAQIEQEKQEGYDNACLDDDNDDDDVIIGNPFKSMNVIKSELEERAKQKKENGGLPGGVKVIHVSPTHSVDTKEEIVLQPRLMQSPVHSIGNPPELMALSSQDIRDDITHAFSVSRSFKPSKSEDDVREKKRLKKPKKRFKNRVVPQCETISHLSNTGELPPLKSAGDVVLNGYPPTSNSPKHRALNGYVNWSQAEELLPYKEVLTFNEPKPDF